MSTNAANFVVEKFAEFVDEKCANVDFESVEEYIEYWLDEGKAPTHCAGDFRIFLCAVAQIFACWHDYRFGDNAGDPTGIGIPWRITKALKGTTRFTTKICDPLWFWYCYLDDEKHIYTPETWHQ